MEHLMLENLQKIYNSMEDESSKTLFLEKLKCSIANIQISEINYKSVDFLFEYNKDIKKQISYEISEKSGGERRVVCYGAGAITKACLYALEKFFNLKVECICDKKFNEKSSDFSGYNVIGIDELCKNYKDALIIVTVENKINIQSIVEDLLQNGFERNDIVIFGNRFLENQYFDEGLIKFGSNEVLYDCGCYDCGTDLEFIKRCSDYKKIIAFEPDPENAKKCEYIRDKKSLDLKLYKCGVWDSKSELCFNADNSVAAQISENGNIIVPVNSIDNISEETGLEATFIKMDIEGSELMALKGAKNTIIKYKPKLAISIYHKPEDIIEIPDYILSLVPDYKLYIRPYRYNGYDTILYAVL